MVGGREVGAPGPELQEVGGVGARVAPAHRGVVAADVPFVAQVGEGGGEEGAELGRGQERGLEVVGGGGDRRSSGPRCSFSQIKLARISWRQASRRGDTRGRDSARSLDPESRSDSVRWVEVEGKIEKRDGVTLP